MFDKMKQLKQVYDLQQKLKDEKVSATFEGVTIVINGKMEILEVHLNPELDQRRQEKALVEAFRDAIRRIQTVISAKMKETPGFNLGL